jgi:hypothetical protein
MNMRISNNEISEAIHRPERREPSKVERQVRALYGRGLPLAAIMVAYGLRAGQLVAILELDVNDFEMHQLEQEARGLAGSR